MNDRALQRLAPAVVVLAAIAVYLNALANGFAFDDIYIVQQNTRVHNLAAWRDIWLTPYWPFFGTELGLYRPFIIFLYAVQWAIGGDAPWIFHAGNLLLHATATLLAYLLLDRLTARVPALVGALIFAVHPLHTEAVANVVGQAELVSAIMLFAACLLHVNRPEGVAVSWPRRIALVILFGIGLMTKESAVVLPGLLVALDFAQRRVRLTPSGMAQYADAMLMPVLLLVATLACYLLLRFDALSGSLIGLDAGPSLPFLREEHRVLNALRAFPEYIRLLFYPHVLAVDYSPGVVLPVDSLTAMTLFGAFLLVALTALALATPWWPAVGLPAAWFLIAISPVSNLFFPIGVLIAERTLYAPSFALSLLIAYAWFAAAPAASRPARLLAPVLTVIVLVLCGIRTWIRNPDWKHTNAVYASLMRDHPESYRSQWITGALLWKSGNPGPADFHFALAYRIYPRDSQLLVEYGNYLLDQGRVGEAVGMLEKAYEVHPYVPRTVSLLAYAYLRAGRYAEALQRTAETEILGADRPTSMPLRASAYHGLGEHDNAIGAWRVAAAHTKNNRWVVLAFLARTLAIMERHEEAAAALEHARDASTDEASRKTLDQLAAALASDCFATAAAASRNRTHIEFPACDPLGDYFTFAERAAKSAFLLQNARAPQPDSAGSNRVPAAENKE